jgi:uncharacterized integral membrane protein
VEAGRRVMVQQSPTPGSASGIGGVPQGAGNVAGPTGGSKTAALSGGVIATLTGGGLLVVFMVQNTQDVTLQFLFWSLTMPLWLFTLMVAILGSIVWIGFGILRRHRRRKARRAARDD